MNENEAIFSFAALIRNFWGTRKLYTSQKLLVQLVIHDYSTFESGGAKKTEAPGKKNPSPPD